MITTRRRVRASRPLEPRFLELVRSTASRLPDRDAALPRARRRPRATTVASPIRPRAERRDA